MRFLSRPQPVFIVDGSVTGTCRAMAPPAAIPEQLSERGRGAGMSSKQSEAVRRRWEAARLAMVQPGGEGPDEESWGELTAEPREVQCLETAAGGRPARRAVPNRRHTDRRLP